MREVCRWQANIVCCFKTWVVSFQKRQGKGAKVKAYEMMHTVEKVARAKFSPATIILEPGNGGRFQAHQKGTSLYDKQLNNGICSHKK